MRLGQYLRFRYGNRKRSQSKEYQETQKEQSWYENLDEIIERMKSQRREQTLSIYSRVYGNVME